MRERGENGAPPPAMTEDNLSGAPARAALLHLLVS